LAHNNKLQFKEFQPFSPEIFGEKAAGAGQRVIFSDLYGAGERSFMMLAKCRDGLLRLLPRTRFPGIFRVADNPWIRGDKRV